MTTEMKVYNTKSLSYLSLFLTMLTLVLWGQQTTDNLKKYTSNSFVASTCTARSKNTSVPSLSVELASQLGLGSPLQVEFTHDAQAFAIRSTRGVGFYLASTFSLLYFLEEPDALSMVLSSSQIFIGKQDGTVIAWDIATHSLTSISVRHDSKVTSLSLIDDERTLVSGSVDTVYLTELHNELSIKLGTSCTYCLFRFNSKLNLLAIGSSDPDFPSVDIWNLTSQLRLYQLSIASNTSIVDIEFNKNGNVLLVGTFYGIVELWNLADGKQIQVVNIASNHILDLWIDDNTGYLIVIDGAGQQQVWNMSMKEKIDEETRYSPNLSFIEFSQDRSSVASIDSYNMVVIKNSSGQVYKFTEYMGRVDELKFSTTKNLLITYSADNVIRFWDLKTKHVIQYLVLSDLELYLYTYSYSQFEMHSDDEFFYLSIDNEVTIWKLSNESTFRIYKHHEDLSAIVFNAEPQMIHLSENGDLVVQDVMTGNVLRHLISHSQNTVLAIWTSVNSHYFATATAHEILIWDITTWRPIKVINGDFNVGMTEKSVSFDSKENFTLYDSSRLIKRWSILDNDEPEQFQWELAPIRGLALNPKSNLLALEYGDNIVSLVSFNNHEPLHTFTLGSSPVTDLTFDTSGELLAIAQDEFVRIYKVPDRH